MESDALTLVLIGADARGRMLTPTGEFGVRRDGDEAETGTKVGFGGSLGHADAARGLSVVVRGRTLVAHRDAICCDWGAGATVHLDPGMVGRSLTPALLGIGKHLGDPRRNPLRRILHDHRQPKPQRTFPTVSSLRHRRL